MKTAFITGCLFVCLFGVSPANSADKSKFKDVEIDKQFEPYLLSNPLLMEVSGAKIIKQKDGSRVIISIASTVLKDQSAKDRLRAERVCHVKAIAGIVSEVENVHVYHSEILNEKNIIIMEDSKTHEQSISELLEVTKTEVKGITKDLPVVGKWKSKDGDVFYLAIGGVLDKTGKLLEVVTDEN